MDNQRINIWELKLLDLTMGNALINTKYGANCMQAVEQDGVSVVEHLVHSEHLTLLPDGNTATGLHFALNTVPLQKEAHKFLHKVCENLENVQGDERDVILFSVCYGPAENGKISMNFGPLNNAGGERRLNVAVTRARQEMVVFSSMTSADIDLEKSNALGVQGLKNFLYYAENGTLPEEPEIARMEIVNPLAEHLAADLRKAGYQVDTNVGKSDFRVDVAVLDIKHPGTYKLGILFDGRGYYRIPMTRDRELVQPMVLEHLGWNLAKVWQEEYFRHPEDVTRTIVELLKKEHLYSQK